MSKFKLIIILLVAVLLVGTAQSFGQAPGGAGGDRGGMGGAGGGMGAGRGGAGQMGDRGGAAQAGGRGDAAQAGGGGGGRGGRGGGGPSEPPYPAAPASGAAPAEMVDPLIAVLNSPTATRIEKSDALRKLQVAGTKETIPVIAKYLTDPELSHMARYALEPLKDPSVDEAFRNALGSVKGPHLVGIIMSIGERRDAQSVQPLAALLKNSDKDVVRATALSLGKIGNAAAVTALTGALNASAANRAELSEGLFLCAEALAGQGQDAAAIAIYDQVLKLDAATTPVGVRQEALRGTIIARKADGIKLLQQYLQSTDYPLFIAATRTSLEMTASGVTPALTDALSKRSENNDKILLIGIIGARKDAAAVPAILTLVKDEKVDAAVRLAAIKILTQVPSAASVPVLTGLMSNSSSDISSAARTAIISMPGKETDDAVLAMLKGSQPAERVVGIELTASRSIKTALPELIRLAGSDTDAKVRQAALKASGSLGGTENLSGLLEVVIKASPEDMDAAVAAITTILPGVTDKTVFAKELITRLGQSQATQKGAILRILGVTGGAESLSAIQAAISDTNPQVHTAALTALSEWPDFDAAKSLVDIAANPNSTLADHVVAIRGAVRLIRDISTAPMADRVSLCLTAYNSTRRDEDKTQVISAMANLRSTEIGDKLIEIANGSAALKSAAGQAVISVATSLYTGQIVTVAPRVQQTLVEIPRSVMSFDSTGSSGGGRGGRGGGGGGGQTVTVTDEDRAAAQELAKKVIAMDISQTVNTNAQNIIDGNVGQRGGRGGAGGGRGGAGGGRGGAAGGGRGGEAGGAPGGRGQ
jgi:HEAT repeat protein